MLVSSSSPPLDAIHILSVAALQTIGWAVIVEVRRSLRSSIVPPHLGHMISLSMIVHSVL